MFDRKLMKHYMYKLNFDLNKFDDSDYFNLKFYNPQKKIELSNFLISMNKKSSKNINFNEFLDTFLDTFVKSIFENLTKMSGIII